MFPSKGFRTTYPIICTSFCAIVVISNILSVKMVTLPLLALSIPAGLIIYPLTFLLSDLVTEIFGSEKSKSMVYSALGISFLSFVIIQISLLLPESLFTEKKTFESILGLSGLRIFSSLISYLASQLVGIKLYAAIKRWTGPKFLWLRNNGSTCVSQIVDTLMIDLIFLWWGLGMTIREVVPIMLFSYAYKAFFSIACTPIFYFLIFLIRGRWQNLKQIFTFSRTLEKHQKPILDLHE